MVYPEQRQQQDEWARQYAPQVSPEQQQLSQQQHSAFTYQNSPEVFPVQQPQQQHNAWGNHLTPSPPHNTGTSATWARQYAPHVIPEQHRQNPWGHQYAPRVSTEQQQQPRAVRGPYAQQPSPSMGINTPTPSSATYSNNYFYGERYLNLGQHSYYNGQTVPTMPPLLTPQQQNNITQQNFVAAPPADQGLTAPALDPHPSDVVSSLSQAMATMPQQGSHCPKDDVTLPATDEDREQWVRMLLNAINNLDGIEGNQGKKNQNSLQKRWRGPLTGPDYYLPADKLILCWTIEDLAERLHRLGPSVFHSFDANFWHQAAKTRNWTFEDRMTWIIELLRVSKTRCDSLLGGSSLQGIVANPAEKLDATRAQAKQNEKRGETLKLGRAIKKQKTNRVT
ncbi:hypothetical protein AA0113_g2851 [Alternaria arborescens]|uniref:Uncharacterized protein n=1 Tax=Alternaria arborescens TaxID=156630 RepID=A0A4Q4SJF3_9PLEO|nr:hypothetical protein AA0113_g2851 [Alternaria arborescens]